MCCERSVLLCLCFFSSSVCTMPSFCAPEKQGARFRIVFCFVLFCWKEEDEKLLRREGDIKMKILIRKEELKERMLVYFVEI